jgi:hypothetical protein
VFGASRVHKARLGRGFFTIEKDIAHIIGTVLSRMFEYSERPFRLTRSNLYDPKIWPDISSFLMITITFYEMHLRSEESVSIKDLMDGQYIGELLLLSLEKQTCIKRLTSATKDEQYNILLLLLGAMSNIVKYFQDALVSFTYLLRGLELTTQCLEEHFFHEPLTQLKARTSNEESVTQLLSMLICYCEVIGERVGIPPHLLITGNSHRSLQQVIKTTTDYVYESGGCKKQQTFLDGREVSVSMSWQSNHPVFEIILRVF